MNEPTPRARTAEQRNAGDTARLPQKVHPKRDALSPRQDLPTPPTYWSELPFPKFQQRVRSHA